MVVDDDRAILETIREFLEHDGYQVISRFDPTRVVDEVREKGIEVVISDIKMPGLGGVELLDRLKEIDPCIVFVVMTAYGTEKLAVDVMKKGAFDYLSKPFAMDEFLCAIRKAVTHIGLVRQNQALVHQVLQSRQLEEMVGQSRQMGTLRDLVRRVASSDVTVLITGESGTGKELVAQSIVNHSPRSAGPFVKINCAALPESLLESELFGHEKGSFTGAHQRQIGKFELASGGTIFLDEIGDMSPSTQTKLLRVIQERCVERLGGKGPIQVDVRLIAATNKDLLAEIGRGTFRDDLYYRLNVIEIRVPSLRDRREDIPLLLDHFLDVFARRYGKARPPISSAGLVKLSNYSWPGNIRELRNYVERLTVLELDGDLERDVETLTSSTGTSAAADPSRQEVVLESLLDAELRHIHRVLAATQGNRAQAAQILKIDAKTLRAKLKREAEPRA
jgi:DNA-binding NtrC family response regulator